MTSRLLWQVSSSFYRLRHQSCQTAPPVLPTKISLDRKLQADSYTGVKVKKQAKYDKVMGPQTWLTFEKNLF